MTGPRSLASVGVLIVVLLAGCSTLTFLPGGNAGEVPRLVTEGEQLTVDSASGQAIEGRTGLQAGTELAIRVRSTGETPFLRSESVTVDESGSFRAEVDFSEVPPGTTFDVTVRHNGTTLIETTGRVVG